MTKVLLIDDSDIALGWSEEALSSRGFEVVTYNMSLGIQVFVRKTMPDIVLLDVNMPALSGDIVCKMLKKSPATRGVAVALYSGLPEEELSQLSDAAGADGWVRKTDDPEALAQHVRDLVA